MAAHRPRGGLTHGEGGDTVRLCAGQLRVEAGDFDRNVLKHTALIDIAVSHQADLIFFPELSLTGYEPKLVANLAVDDDDPRLDVFQALAEAGDIVIGVGVPARSAEGIRIATVLFQPRGERLSYAKQQLHRDELPFFVQGDRQVIVPLRGHTIAPAICYESLRPEHADAAAGCNADVYLASVAKPQRHMSQARRHYARIAKQFALTVLMANAVGPCDDFVGAGQSAAWNNSGELVANLDSEAEGLVLFDTGTGEGGVVLA